MTKKILYKANRAIKSPLKFAIGGFLIFLGLMIGNWVLAFETECKAIISTDELGVVSACWFNGTTTPPFDTAYSYQHCVGIYPNCERVVSSFNSPHYISSLLNDNYHLENGFANYNGFTDDDNYFIAFYSEYNFIGNVVYFIATRSNAIWYGQECNVINCGLCESWVTCQMVKGCFWDFQYNYCLPYEFCCGCGFENEKCLFCDSQEKCEGITDCYWAENFCWYAGEQCGAGLNCQFCQNQETCEIEGCFWYGDYCWLEEKPIISSWTDWYDSYGDYENPAPLVNTLASGSQNFFESIGGFLITFKKMFDLQTAFQNGKNFGSVIPVARGYLTTLDDFVGALPFGTYFLFILIFMLAVGTFRIIRALIQLIKFW